MKKILLLLLIILVHNISFAQKISITGAVVEAETNQKLEYATIILKPINNDSLTGGITDVHGNFNVEVKKGTYIVSVEFISYQTQNLGEKTFTKNTNIGTISLNLSAESLDEVEIIAEKSTVEIRLDKKIYNVGKDMTVKGGNATDVLDNVPSVTVDVEGVVSLRGNDNVRILINGKPSNFSATEALKQLSADAIKKVEVITSPSARYDAEGSAGIINIILRKGKAQGLNGTLNLNAKNPEGYGSSANFNFRVKKFNFFTNIGYSNANIPGNALFDNEYLQEETNPFSKENRKYNRDRKNFNSRLGLTYAITDKTSVTGSMSYVKANRDNDTAIKLNILDQNNNQTGFSTRNELEDEKSTDLEYNFNITQKFNTSGHILTFDVKYDISDSDELATIIGEEFLPNPQIKLQEKTSKIENKSRTLFKADYVLPIGENAQFEAGFKYHDHNLELDYILQEEQENGSFLINTDVSNLFSYDENITAFYTQYGNKFKAFSMLLGLRAEVSDINIISEGETNKKNYTKWFPTLNLTYEISEKEDITLGYNRRIRRPHAYFLNPFLSRASETNIFQGNPNLNPAYTNGIDIGYLKKWQKITFNTSFYYNYTTDVFQFIRENTGEVTASGVPIIRMTPKNIAEENRLGLEFSVDYKAFKWWKLNTSFNFYQVEKNGKGVIPNSKNDSWNTRLTSRIKLPLKIDWQTTVNYRAPHENFQSKIKSITSINLAFSKDLLKDKATISLNVSDLLNTRKRRATTFIEGFSYTNSEFQWRERQIRLNFTYRFNQKKRWQRGQKRSIRFSDDG